MYKCTDSTDATGHVAARPPEALLNTIIKSVQGLTGLTLRRGRQHVARECRFNQVILFLLFFDRWLCGVAA